MWSVQLWGQSPQVHVPTSRVVILELMLPWTSSVPCLQGIDLLTTKHQSTVSDFQV